MRDPWDEWNLSGGPRYPHEKVIQFCFRSYSADERSGVRALDLGCGSGANTVFLAGEGFLTTATDRSKIAIDNTRARLDAEGLSATLRVEAIDGLDFAPASFDLAICVGVFDSAGPAAAAASLNRLREVLAPRARGLFLFADELDYRVKGPNPLGLHGFTQHLNGKGTILMTICRQFKRINGIDQFHDGANRRIKMESTVNVFRHFLDRRMGVSTQIFDRFWKRHLVNISNLNRLNIG